MSTNKIFMIFVIVPYTLYKFATGGLDDVGLILLVIWASMMVFAFENEMNKLKTGFVEKENELCKLRSKYHLLVRKNEELENRIT
tara:strand:- start:211 stop:465 length:255 start_codon:yes stop_codon:yes gene_type:complete